MFFEILQIFVEKWCIIIVQCLASFDNLLLCEFVNGKAIPRRIFYETFGKGEL